MRLRDLIGRYRDGLTLAILVVVCLTSLLISTDSMYLKPAEVGQSVIAIAQQSAAGIGRFFAGTVASIRELSELRREYDELLSQVMVYRSVADDVAQLQAENERLRQALGFEQSIPFETIPARVIAKEPGTFFAGITINKGRAAGVRRDMPVIANQEGAEGLVGRVHDVGLTTAVIMPVFDSNSFVAARLQRSRHEGLVSGAAIAEDRLSMLYVAKAARADIMVNDVAITSGMRSIFPEGIRIGTVETIQGRPYETSLSIGLRPAVDFSRLEYVFVLTGAGP